MLRWFAPFCRGYHTRYAYVLIFCGNPSEMFLNQFPIGSWNDKGIVLQKEVHSF
jgi:hypothetical protein